MPNKKFITHPTYEELLSHLEKDDGGSERAADQVRQHLESCPECAAELAGWQRTIQKLRSCDLPQVDQVPAAHNWSLLQWAVAAVFILFIGVALGRLMQPS